LHLSVYGCYAANNLYARKTTRLPIGKAGTAAEINLPLMHFLSIQPLRHLESCETVELTCMMEMH